MTQKQPEFAHVLALVVVGSVLMGVAMVNYWRADTIDFHLFFWEGHAWLEGRDLYAGTGVLNMNSPALTAFVFGPLALLPLPAAQGLWMAVSVAAFAASVRLIAQTLELNRRRTVAFVAMICVTHGSFVAWATGQLVWPLLFYPLTRAWLAYRAGRSLTAGAWLAPAIVAKPPLAVLALLLATPTWLVAGTISAGVSIGSVPLTGTKAWLDWFQAGAGVNWLSPTLNASLWGVAARWQVGGGRVTVSALDPFLVTGVVAVAALLAWRTLIEPCRDRRFLCAGLSSVLISPLGWVYYLPLFAGPAAALWTGSRQAMWAYALLLPPLGMQEDLGIVGGSVFFVATVCGWVALRPERDHGRVSSASAGLAV